MQAWAICAIEIAINEHTEEILGDIFDKIYVTTYGVKIFPDPHAEYDDANPFVPQDVNEIEFLTDLPYPEFDTEWIEIEVESLTDQTFVIDTTAISSVDTDAYMSFKINFDVNLYY